MGVDVRTRVDGELRPIELDEFFGRDLPAALEGAGERLAPTLDFLPLRPLTIVVGESGWLLRVDGDRAVVAPAGPLTGDLAGVVLRITVDQLGLLVADQVTPMGWLAGGTLDIEGGRLADVLNWWLVLRASLDGTTPHVPGAVALTDERGVPLDLGRAFAPDDPPEEMAAFLVQAGYLHVSGLFTEAEMAAVSADMDRAAPRYAKGDGRSWWAQLDDGSDALVRMQGFDRESPAVAELVDDDRLQGLATLTGDGHRFGRRSDNRIEALFKPIGVVEGISDIPWHKDCSLGRHSYDCCAVTVGISVTGADATSGQLRVVAGSHRALVWPAPVLQPGLDLPVVDLATRTGDITVHLSCTLHMAQPPVTTPRRVMYTSFGLPSLAPEAATEARRRIGAMRESAPVTVSQPPSPVAPR
ncbi:MAG TPA: phytanoyl-CoA dioxygenase family protein [Acidimicrobiales bacterium]|nr:phytanoyl-CoA dioxygenase family protein [Acidimicrobiales bacterium]